MANIASKNTAQIILCGGRVDGLEITAPANATEIEYAGVLYTVRADRENQLRACEGLPLYFDADV